MNYAIQVVYIFILKYIVFQLLRIELFGHLDSSFKMHTRLNSTLITLLICVVISVDANRQHRHQSQHESDSSGSHNSINVKTRSKEENVDLSPNKTPDLMREYMSRQLFQCSADHLGMLAKLNAIIAVCFSLYHFSILTPFYFRRHMLNTRTVKNRSEIRLKTTKRRVSRRSMTF